MDEQLLQDYLDDRLTAERRGEFEARLRGDADLRARLDEALEIRAALREDSEELSPAFYARARARFEHTRSAPRTGAIRWLSWEAAGLAAAALLVIAVFLPALLREGVPVGPESAAARQQDTLFGAQDDESAGSRPIAAPAPTPAATVADKEFAAEQDNEIAQFQDAPRPVAAAPMDEAAPRSARTEEPARQLAEAKASTSSDDRGQAPSRVPDKRAIGESGRRDAGKGERPSAPGEASDLTKNSEALAPPESASRERFERAAEAEEPAAEGRVRAKARIADGVGPVGATVSELRVGAVTPGTVRIIDDAVAARRLVEQSEPRFAPDPDANEAARVVVIGPRDHMRCESLRVEHVDGTYRVLIVASRTRADSPGGCAVTLPAGASVEVIDTATGERLDE